eukprot:m.48543 g.48543  ORF g.48543 m.48543 type:complete len:314 (+) comp7402_c1_seq2:178-1119(+)
MPRARARGRGKGRRTKQQRFRLQQEHKNDLMTVLNISNKIVETLMTLLAIYLLTELHAVPQGCRYYSCVQVYSEAVLNITAEGDGEPDFFVRPCSNQREFCKFSYGNEEEFLHSIEDAENRGLEVDLEAIDKLFGPMRKYCRCLLSKESEYNKDVRGSEDSVVFCQFGFIRSAFFIVAILIVALMEATISVKGLRHHILRLISFIMTFLLYICIYIYFNAAQSSCDSYELQISLRVINSICYSSFFVLSVTTIAELLFWNIAFKKARDLKKDRFEVVKVTRTVRKGEFASTTNEDGDFGHDNDKSALLMEEYA